MDSTMSNLYSVFLLNMGLNDQTNFEDYYEMNNSLAVLNKHGMKSLKTHL